MNNIVRAFCALGLAVIISIMVAEYFYGINIRYIASIFGIIGCVLAIYNANALSEAVKKREQNK